MLFLTLKLRSLLIADHASKEVTSKTPSVSLAGLVLLTVQLCYSLSRKHKNYRILSTSQSQPPECPSWSRKNNFSILFDLKMILRLIKEVSAFDIIMMILNTHEGQHIS